MRGQLQRFGLQQGIDDGAKIRIMRSHHHGHGKLGRLQWIMAAGRNQAPANEGDRGQRIHRRQLADRIQQNHGAGFYFCRTLHPVGTAHTGCSPIL